MDFVLVHGTTQSPASWARVATLLTAAGHRAIAVDLLTPEDLPVEGYAQHVREQYGGERPVVVAHSGSGVLLPAIAEALGARALVWLAAYIPDFPGGKCLRDEARTMLEPDWIGVDPTADPAKASEFLFHDCDSETEHLALDSLRLFDPAVLAAHPAGPAPEIPSTVIVPTRDRTLKPVWQRRAARERLGVTAIEIDAGHCPHVSRPAEIAGILTGRA
ncbi:alpha/beta fold hydrolase [Amycolatopsis regifaucium]|uniref:Alpha/beta hydrolase n=1 Tax=Amycolatopsis regifaucium TaxID=546365 RepID=A0A154MMP1_9PSEU|nr:alpha/beta hydrolase [Amycolatopsis regifaucium]KZB85618.1 alpha/beta hydrolase [Amycolatopsis regifaucium]OKA10629.1 alpha/beta hydrolase [Amycolatopsis regifaucium]SFI84632.1 Lysophospholipase, alpha-beta hydrolase superfamily [Amycolatopsis regifaucium]